MASDDAPLILQDWDAAKQATWERYTESSQVWRDLFSGHYRTDVQRMVKYAWSDAYDHQAARIRELEQQAEDGAREWLALRTDAREQVERQAARIAQLERAVIEVQTRMSVLLSYDTPDEVAASLRVLEAHCAAALLGEAVDGK